jgi:hypothetical protein
MGTELMAQSGRALSIPPAGHGSIPKMRTLLLFFLLTSDRKHPETGNGAARWQGLPPGCLVGPGATQENHRLLTKASLNSLLMDLR